MSFTDPATLFWAFLLAGFSVGFGHCIGMCGPIAVSLSLNLKGKSIYGPHLLYHAGRVITYGLLGAVMGMTGSFAGTAARIAGMQRIVMIFAGLFVMTLGLMMGQWLPLGRIFRDHPDSPGFIQKGFRKLSSRFSPSAYLPLGLLLGLLPCGPVYTALVAAAGAGVKRASHWEGALTGTGVMVAFGIGSTPALLLVARLTTLRWLTQRHLVYRIGALLMVFMGAGFIFNALRG